MNAPTIDLPSLTKSHWSDSDKQNVATVVDFVQLIMNDHNFEELRRRFGDSPYVQHNRTIGDGIEGVINTVSSLVKNAPEFSYEVKHIYVDGDHVSLHSHATLKAKHRGNEKQGLNIVDTWKVENGKPVEHWDAVQAMSWSMRLYNLLTGGAIRNGNGVF